MKTAELILVTGATGFLGVRLVRELLDRQPDAALALLIRDRPGESGQQRADQFIVPADRHRVQVYSGDVGQSNCGLDSATYQRLTGEVTRVIMKFSLPTGLPFSVPGSPRAGLLNGHEYVWHCHILEHEEHDMMRPLVILP